MSTRRWTRWTIAATTLTLTMALVPAMASAEGPADKAGVQEDGKKGRFGKKGKRARRGKRGKRGALKKNPAFGAVKQYYGANKRLAEAYLVSGDYGKAVNHFEAIINYTPDLEKMAKEAGVDVEARKKARAARAGDKAKKGKRSRRGRRGHHGPMGRLHRLKVHAFLGAAAASHHMGDAKGATRFAKAGLTYADTHNLRRATDMFERFLADPASGASKVAPTAEQLEARVDEARKKLPR